jgi:hypothetical protein
MQPGSAKTGHPHLFMPAEVPALAALPRAASPRFFVRKIFLAGNGTIAASEAELRKLIERK